MKRLPALVFLLLAHSAQAEETPAFSKISALQTKLLVFLTGAEPPGLSPDVIPGLTQREPPPTWLVHWQTTLLRDLQQPDLKNSQHPLLHTPIQVVRLQPPGKPQFQLVLAAPLPPDALLCPRDAPVRLQVQMLHPGDDATTPWLGVDVACVDTKPTLRRQVRLLVQLSAAGQVQRAFGVEWTLPVPLTSQPEPQAAPEYVMRPTLLDKRFTWLVALPSGGWLAQLEGVATASWQTDNALPRFEDLAAEELATSAAGDNRDVQRYTLLLAEDGTPRAALLHGPVDAAGRLPLWREGAWDLALPATPDDAARTLILQRVAKPSLADNAHPGRAWTHASYAIWQVTHATVQPVELPLVPLDQEGVWDCEAEPPVQKILCSFRRLGPNSEGVAETRQFTLLPGPLAAFTLQPPGQ